MKTLWQADVRRFSECCAQLRSVIDRCEAMNREGNTATAIVMLLASCQSAVKILKGWTK